MVKKLTLVLVFSSVLLVWVACAMQQRSALQPHDTRSTSLEIDVSKQLTACWPLWTNRHVSPGTPPLNWSLADSANGFDFLTTQQQMQLGGWVTPGGGTTDLLILFFEYWDFEKATGLSPQSGAQLVEWTLGNYPDPSVVRIDALHSEELPNWYYHFVNPQTGRLYQSFDGSIPEPGGVIFHRLEDKADAVRAFAGRSGADRYGNQTNGGFEIIVKDTDPNKVLDTAVVLFRTE